MGRESMMNRADQQAKHLIHYGDVLDVKKKLRKVAEIKVDDVHKAARRIFSAKPTLAALGPLRGLEPYETVRGRFSSAA